MGDSNHEKKDPTSQSNGAAHECAPLIAFRSPGFPYGIRLANQWGPTTGRHFNELGCGGFLKLAGEDFAAAASHELTGYREVVPRADSNLGAEPRPMGVKS